jgi:phage terminase small subunit
VPQSGLSANVSIRARLNALLVKAAERTLATVERVTAELEEARQLALSNKSAASAVSASISKAKLHKLLE